MAKKEHLINEYPIERIESEVFRGEFTREDLEEHKFMFLAPGIDLED